MDKLDELDYAILRMLIKDAKTPYTEVGKLLNVSSGTVHVRMR
jgi:Lrp/AsnC family transcriptional regulator for asnA, asnC and gidA